MKLKRTLSLIVSGICLAAATTAALAGTNQTMNCLRCGETTATAYYTEARSGRSHTYIQQGRKRICRYTAVYTKETYKCDKCGFPITFSLEYIGDEGHECPQMY